MDPPEQPFSRRQGLRKTASEPPIWDEAPESLRIAILNAARGIGRLGPQGVRDVVCDVLLCRPDKNNWSDDPVWNEVLDHVEGCQWFQFFDLVEKLAPAVFRRTGDPSAFQTAVNGSLEDANVGWRLRDGLVVAMADDTARPPIDHALKVLEDHHLATAQTELHEAIKDISRRPEADCSGAVQHAMAALEAVARHVTGDAKRTLGEILKHHRDLVREPLKTGLEKLWGYTSDQARHGREGNAVEPAEARVVVGIAAALVPYLISKLPASSEE
ncbi:MAG: hypothetical protein IT462_08695 [Planctomycetes bacterium]|nr:hypothetical protein [Planctomycetota bacterium]